MVKIEDLMQYASRRKVEAIAAQMGYPKATEYPDEVLQEVQARCSKKQRSPAVAQTNQPQAIHPEELEVQANSSKQRSHAAAANEASQQEILHTAHEDLQDVDEGSQYRAAAMRVGGDALTLYYYATARFTIPGLNEKVEESRNNLRQALKGVAAAYDPEHFLAQTHLAQMAAGRNGSMRSLNGNSSPADEFLPEDDGELSGSP